MLLSHILVVFDFSLMVPTKALKLVLYFAPSLGLYSLVKLNSLNMRVLRLKSFYTSKFGN